MADVVTLKGERGSGGGPYLIDTIPVPLENPYGSPMFLTGLDFFPNGDAAVSTFYGGRMDRARFGPELEDGPLEADRSRV